MAVCHTLTKSSCTACMMHCRSPQTKDRRDGEREIQSDGNKKAEMEVEEEEEEKTQEQLEEEELMKKVMGFTHFDSTKVVLSYRSSNDRYCLLHSSTSLHVHNYTNLCLHILYYVYNGTTQYLILAQLCSWWNMTHHDYVYLYCTI